MAMTWRSLFVFGRRAQAAVVRAKAPVSARRSLRTTVHSKELGHPRCGAEYGNSARSSSRFRDFGQREKCFHRGASSTPRRSREISQLPDRKSAFRRAAFASAERFASGTKRRSNHGPALWGLHQVPSLVARLRKIESLGPQKKIIRDSYASISTGVNDTQNRWKSYPARLRQPLQERGRARGKKSARCRARGTMEIYAADQFRRPAQY